MTFCMRKWTVVQGQGMDTIGGTTHRSHGYIEGLATLTKVVSSPSIDTCHSRSLMGELAICPKSRMGPIPTTCITFSPMFPCDFFPN